jgi:hypothetical protein
MSLADMMRQLQLPIKPLLSSQTVPKAWTNRGQQSTILDGNSEALGRSKPGASIDPGLAEAENEQELLLKMMLAASNSST